MSARPAVVVTGASSGIGHATALELARCGFRVFAAVRAARDGESVQAEASGELEPLSLDVTDEEAIAAAAEQVASGTGEDGLSGLVNNAGVAYAGPLEFVPLADVRHQLEVNLVGQLAVTRAMLPALRRPGGRIVNVSSIGGLVASPFYGPYCASKFGLEAVSDCMRTELRPWGIRTIVVEPGSVATSIWSRGVAIATELRGRMDPEAEGLYGEAMEATERTSKRIGERGIPPEAAARTIHKALTVRRPRARYRVGTDAHVMALAHRLLPSRLHDDIVARAMGLP